jgi:hypothetical protein
MARYAIVVNDAVLNVVEADAANAESYAAREGGIAVESTTASPGDSYGDGEFARPAVVVPVPQSVTRRQARQALRLAGLLGSVQAAIDSIPDDLQRDLAQIEWDDSQEFQRHRPLLIALATQMELTSEQLDNLFRTAAAL